MCCSEAEHLQQPRDLTVLLCLRCTMLCCALLCCALLQDESGDPMVDKLFGVKLQTKLKCEETGEEYTVSRTQPKCSSPRSAQHAVTRAALSLYMQFAM